MSAGWLKSALLSLFFLVVLVGAWHLATLPKGERQAAGDEDAKLLGKGAKKSEGFPTPAQIGETIVKNLSEPFYDRGPTINVSALRPPIPSPGSAWATSSRFSSPCRSASSSACRP